MEKFPWNSMEIDVLILHGIPWRIFHGNPWNSMEVFHTGHKNGDLRVVSGNEAKLRRADLESVGSSNKFLYWARIIFMLTCHFQP